MSSSNYTHRVAVNAFLIHGNQFLLLKRAKKPLIWGPPGGKLRIDEDPIIGLQRELQEETGLQVQLFQPVTTWFGHFGDVPLLSIDYLCTSEKSVVRLSHEHNDFRWLTIEELSQHKDIFFNSDLGFKLSDYRLAWQSYLMKQKNSNFSSNNNYHEKNEK